jgi:hypothetical protein
MAEVWEGRDDVLSRPVAVKVLLSHLAADPFLRERFKREAVTAARLVHPGIVAIFDAGVEVLGDNGAGAGTVLSGSWSRDENVRLEMEWPEQPSTAFIVMELVPGETLRDLMLRSGPLDAELAVAIASQVTDALAHAHAHGLVHRDIKPANVLLRDEGGDMVRVKVADFGIAKAASTSGDLTANGTFLGTPKYVSPEQVQGHEPDPRADLYSLGVVLFEMLAGRPPFRESTDMATALAHVQKAPPRLEQFRADLPEGLADLVATLLAKDPAYRVGSALALEGALTSVRKRMGAPASEPGAYLYLGAGSAPAAAQTVAGMGREPPSAPHPLAASGPPRSSPARALAPAGTRGGTLNLPRNSTAAQGAPSPGGPQRPPRHYRTGRVTGTVVLSLLVLGSLVALALFHPHPVALAKGKPSRPGTLPPSTVAPPENTYPPVPVEAVYEMAQDGNHPDDDVSGLPNVIGDNPSAFWHSDQYQRSDFGGYGGLGLVLKLHGARTLHDLFVTTPMQDWSAEVYVSGADSPELAGWGRPTDEHAGVNGSAVFSLSGKSGSWVLFWMLNPGPTNEAVVDKVSVR